MESIGAIVLCRLDSSRLRGKVLMPFHARPLLAHIIARCRQVPAFALRVVVATSVRGVDDPIADYCASAAIPVFRGSAADVAGRILACATAHGLTWFARVNADSPFVDPGLLQVGCELAAAQDLEFVTNLVPRSYPYGVSVEIVKTQAYRRMYEAMTDASDREHVTAYLYQHLDRIRYAALPKHDCDASKRRLTLDTPDDLREVHALLSRSESTLDKLSYRQILEMGE